MEYYFDTKDKDFVYEDEINPWSSSERYIHIEDWKISKLIRWIQEDKQEQSNIKDIEAMKSEIKKKSSMQKLLIIDVSEEDYRECKFRKDLLSLGGEPTDLTFNIRMETLIANGMPLSEELEELKIRISNKCGYDVCCNAIDDRINELKEKEYE